MATAVTTGVWTGTSVQLEALEGLNTDVMRWGTPAAKRYNPEQKKSGYRFAGVQVAVPTDGSEFMLGTFTHENFTIKGTPKFQAYLKVTMVFDDGALSKDFSFTFDHNETPNVAGDAEASADRVTLPTLLSPETVTLDGVEYAVEITGFKQDGKVVTEFISYESRANSAEIVARLAAVEKPVTPEPCDPCQGTSLGCAAEQALSGVGDAVNAMLCLVGDLAQSTAEATVPCEGSVEPPDRCATPVTVVVHYGSATVSNFATILSNVVRDATTRTTKAGR